MSDADAEFLVDLIAEHLFNSNRQPGENWWRSSPVTPSTQAMYRKRASAILDVIISASATEKQWRVEGADDTGETVRHDFIGPGADARARISAGWLSGITDRHWTSAPTVKRRYVIRTPWLGDDE